MSDPFGPPEPKKVVEQVPTSTPLEMNPLEYASYVQASRKFLDKYGIDVSELSDKDVTEKIQKIKDARKAHVQILHRGTAVEGIRRLMAFVPKGFIGEFKRDTDVDIHQAQALGWTVLIDDKAKLASSTGTADGRVRLGDCILMIMPEEKYIAMRLAKEDGIRERRAKRKKKATQPDNSGADPLFPLKPM